MGFNDDNVTVLINRKTVGIDQLEEFDAAGIPGPGVTAEMAFAKVRQLSERIARLTKQIEDLDAQPVA